MDVSALGSGQGSRSNIQQTMLDKLAAADTNGDGGLSVEELPADEGVTDISELFTEMDADGDGLVSEDELLSFADEKLASMQNGGNSSTEGNLLETLLNSLNAEEDNTTANNAVDDPDTSASEDYWAMLENLEQSVYTRNAEAAYGSAVDVLQAA